METEIKIYPKKDTYNSNPGIVTLEITDDEITLSLDYGERRITFSAEDLVKVLRLIEFLYKGD